MRGCTSGVTVARYYDPLTGQFLTRDPAAASTREPYGYVAGDPTDGTDPSGLFCLLGHSGSGCRGGGTYDWAVTNLDPISYALPAYAAEADAVNNNCSWSTVAKDGLEGTAWLAMGGLGPEDDLAAEGGGGLLRRLRSMNWADDTGAIGLGRGSSEERNLIYEANPKHGPVARSGPRGEISRAPRGDCQAMLECSVQVGDRVREGVEPETSLQVIFRMHREFDGTEWWHGYVPGG